MHWKPGSWILIGLLVATLTATGTAEMPTTHVADTIYHADGTVATGTALISWPAFTTSGGESIPSGSTSAAIAANGVLSVDLVPNAGSTPMGSYYTVVYHLDNGSITRQYWVVPQSAAPVKVSAIESSVMPTSVAMQTVSKSYVDTAIAAAVTGYPPDSTPYVLKTGDTLTGPLLLPGDPVSSMQAADKHYVDASVAAVAGGIGGGTSGGPQNAVPAYIVSPSGGVASEGPTHLSVDSNGYNLTGYHSAWTNLGVAATLADCTFPGATYLNGSCVYESTVDAGTSAISGHNFSFNAYGPGGNPTVSAGEGPSTVVLSDDGSLANASIRNIWQSSTAAFGVGDFVGMNWFHTGNAGVAFPSDEGIELVKNDGGQQEYWGGTARGYFQASVAAGGPGTQTPAFAGVHGCTNLFQKCAPAAGTPLLDITQGGDVGYLTGLSVAFSGAPLGWLKQLPTTGGLSRAMAWGYQTGARVAPNTVTDAPVAQTLVLQGGAGTFAPGLACVIGSNYEEQSVIASVSGSAPTQTLQLPLAYPNADVAIFQGPCKFISFNGDLALGTRTAYPGISIDGTNLVYAVPNYGNMGWITLPQAGSEPETTAGAGDPKAGFATYCGARITKLTGLNPLVTHLEQNGCNWAANDAVEDPDFPVQNIAGYTSRINMNTPATGNAWLAGARISISGMGAAGSSHGLEVNNLFANVDCSPYSICGGNLTPPNMMTSNFGQPGGWWWDNYLGHYAPQNAVLEFQDHAPGQTSYFIFKDENWGNLTIDNTNTFHAAGNFAATGKVSGYSFDGIVMGSSGTTYGCFNNINSFCPDGSTNPDSHVTGLDIDTLHQTIGGTFGNGGSTSIIANTPGDTRVGGTLQLFGSARGDSLQDSVLIGNDAGMAIEIDGSASGHKQGNVGIGYSVGSVIPSLFSVNGTAAASLLKTGTTPNTGIGGGVSALFTSSGYGTAELQGTNTANNRAAFVLSGNFGGSYHGLWEFGTDAQVNGTGDMYFFNYATSSEPLYLGANDDIITNGNVGVTSGKMLGWGSGANSAYTRDTGISRESAGVLDVGNGTQGDKSGTLNAGTVSANIYKGPATAPTGACSVVGWAFSQDGHATFCNGSVWVTKI